MLLQDQVGRNAAKRPGRFRRVPITQRWRAEIYQEQKSTTVKKIRSRDDFEDTRNISLRGEFSTSSVGKGNYRIAPFLVGVQHCWTPVGAEFTRRKSSRFGFQKHEVT